MKKIISKRCLFLIIFFYLFSLSSVFSQDPPEILEIRTLYGSTTGAVVAGGYASVSIGFGDISYDGTGDYGTAELYGSPSNLMLAMVKKNQSSPAYTIYTEYLYYPDGELAFVYERTILTKNQRKIEHRYYVCEGALIRYLVDVDSKRTAYNEDLSLWNIQFEAHASDARAMFKSYLNSFGPLLSSIAAEPEHIEITMEGGEEDISLQIETGSDVWNIGVVDNIYAAMFEPATQDGRALVRYFSFTGGEGIRYVVRADAGFLNVGSTRYGAFGEYNSRVLSLPIGTMKSVSLNAPFYGEEGGDGEMYEGETDERAPRKISHAGFSVPSIALSQSGASFAVEDAAETSKKLDKAFVKFLEQRVFDQYFYYESNWIEGEWLDTPRALVSSTNGNDCIYIYRWVPELAEFQGESVYEAGFDVFQVDLDSVSGGSPYSVLEVEWLSENELYIKLYLDGKNKAVTAILD